MQGDAKYDDGTAVAPPTTPFYFSYNNAKIATDSTTGQSVYGTGSGSQVPTTYPGEQRPKGYRVGSLLGEPFRIDDDDDGDTSAIYFNYRATLRRQLAKPPQSIFEAKYLYWFQFEAFLIEDGKDSLSFDQEPKIHFTHTVKYEPPVVYALTPSDSAITEPELDQPLIANLNPSHSAFNPNLAASYRVVLTSESKNTVTTGTVGEDGKTVAITTTGTAPIVLTHSTTIYGGVYDTVVDTIATPDAYQVRVLPFSWIKAWVAVEFAPTFLVPYEARGGPWYLSRYFGPGPRM